MARLLKLEELREYKTENYLLWWESKDKSIVPFTILNPVKNIYCKFIGNVSGKIFVAFSGNWKAAEEYGKTWRCWEGKPTEEQKMAVKWE